ncbi:MAG TPA: hypothetical protein VFB22_09830 [Candidatus Baltobacteraceae bacterium]|nr:hypothetical protein [Candidatus Baltobacteraceae bacterium]
MISAATRSYASEASRVKPVRIAACGSISNASAATGRPSSIRTAVAVAVSAPGVALWTRSS